MYAFEIYATAKLNGISQIYLDIILGISYACLVAPFTEGFYRNALEPRSCNLSPRKRASEPRFGTRVPEMVLYCRGLHNYWSQIRNRICFSTIYFKHTSKQRW